MASAGIVGAPTHPPPGCRGVAAVRPVAAGRSSGEGEEAGRRLGSMAELAMRPPPSAPANMSAATAASPLPGGERREAPRDGGVR